MRVPSSILLGLLIVAAAVPVVPPATAAPDPDCSFRDMDWGEYHARPDLSRKQKLQLTMARIDTHRLLCQAEDYKDAIVELTRYYGRNPCASVELAGMQPGDSQGSDGIVEINHQSEAWPTRTWAGEAHVYVQDPTCGYESAIILAATPASGGNAVLAFGEDWSPDRTMVSFFAYKQGNFVGAGADGPATVPACGLNPIGDPVDPAWPPLASPPLPAPSAFGSPWATAPYGTVPFFPALNPDGHCLHGDWQVLVEIVDDVIETLAIPGLALTPAYGYVKRYEFALPTGGFLYTLCVTIETTSTVTDPCGALGGTALETAFTLVSGVFVEPTDPEPVTLRLCEATLTMVAFESGIVDMPWSTVCV